MKITNNFNLPAALVEAIKRDMATYTGPDCDIGVTSLNGPPQIRALRKQYDDQLEEDVTDRLSLLFGKGIHTILERAEPADDNVVTEKQYVVTIDGVRVGAVIDRLVLLPDGILQDYKTGKVWKYIYQDFDDITEQLNCYAYILRQHDVPISTLQGIYMWLDWSKRRAQNTRDWPQAHASVIDLAVWPDAKCLKHLRKRIALHRLAQVPACTTKDTWYKGSKWAVMKQGRKSAMRVLSSPEEASAWLQANTPGTAAFSVVERQGEHTRCVDWCPVRSVCPQAKANGSQP